MTSPPGRPGVETFLHLVKKKYLTPALLSVMITQVIEMERIVEQTMLYDFYGELLTDHQKAVYEDVVLNDYSLSEVAEEYGISRQGVHDLVKRCNTILANYEEKLHLVEKFLKTKELADSIRELTENYKATGDASCMDEISRICGEIEEL